MHCKTDGRVVRDATLVAYVWRFFGKLALAGTKPDRCPTYSYQYSTAKRVVWRDGVLRLDNGHCRDTELVSYFVGRGPPRTADCKPNEVDVPSVLGMALARAKLRLGAQPLTPNGVYKPARAKHRLVPRPAQFT